MKKKMMSAKDRRLAALAEPKDKITQADVIAGRTMKIKKGKKKNAESVGDLMYHPFELCT